MTAWLEWLRELSGRIAERGYAGPEEFAEYQADALALFPLLVEAVCQLERFQHVNAAMVALRAAVEEQT